MPTAATTQSLAQISQYLWVVDVLKSASFQGGSININKPMILYMERKALEWGVSQLSVKVDTNNYLLANGSDYLLTSGDDKFLI